MRSRGRVLSKLHNHDRPVAHHLGVRSWDTDDSYLRNHLLPKFGHLHLDQISTEGIIEMHHGMKAKGYAAASANRAIVLLRYADNLGKKWRVPGCETNPTHGIDLFEVVNAKERYLSRAEAQKLIQTVQASENAQLRYIVPLLLLLGCRKRELLDAQRQDFDIERRSWRIPMTKNGRPRHVPLSEKVLEILSQLPRWAAGHRLSGVSCRQFCCAVLGLRSWGKTGENAIFGKCTKRLLCSGITLTLYSSSGIMQTWHGMLNTQMSLVFGGMHCPRKSRNRFVQA